jgi:hypothetical protein
MAINTNSISKLRVTACLPFGKTRYFHEDKRAGLKWKAYKTSFLTEALNFFLAWLLFLPGIAFAANEAKPQPDRDTATCELKIEGRPLEKLVLADEQGKITEIDRPGASVLLAPGRYEIKEMRVVWEDDGCAYTDTDVNYITFGHSNTCRLVVGTPETPKIAVRRRGRIISLNYDFREVGQTFQNVQRTIPPRIGIYQGDEKIASGAFAFG